MKSNSRFFKKKNFLLKLQIRMDQYFDRLDKATRNEQLPVRIRFMIQDVIDMRRNKWQARRIGKGPDGPRTIAQVREDAARDGCIYMPQVKNPDPDYIISGF